MMVAFTGTVGTVTFSRTASFKKHKVLLFLLQKINKETLTAGCSQERKKETLSLMSHSLKLTLHLLNSGVRRTH